MSLVNCLELDLYNFFKIFAGKFLKVFKWLLEQSFPVRTF